MPNNRDSTRREMIRQVLMGIVAQYGVPERIRVDNGPEFIAFGSSGWAGKQRAGSQPCSSVRFPTWALWLLSSRALSSGWARRIYHEPLRGKQPNYLTQNGPKMKASPT